MNNITQLYLLPPRERPLIRTYLEHQLRDYHPTNGEAFVYANFVSSLDGRIAISQPGSSRMTSHNNVANNRD